MFSNFGLPTPVTSSACDIVWLHCFVNSVLLGVLVFVSCLLFALCSNKGYFKTPGLVYPRAELACMLVPILLLLVQLAFSLSILYKTTTLDAVPCLTIKVTGHQWYWHYEVSDIPNASFDSFMLQIEDLLLGDPRLLSVDARLVVPCNMPIRFCVTSADVIHSWSIPSAGVKIDAIAGVLNVAVIKFPVVGVYYGQCSEICGAAHSYMPIVLEVTLWEPFVYWAFLMSSA